MQCIKTIAALIAAASVLPQFAAAQNSSSSSGESKKYEIKQPSGNWQVPGEIKQPSGPWKVPGDIQIPKGIQAVKVVESTSCNARIAVGADALFEFDKSDLSADAAQTLDVLVAMLKEKQASGLTIEGHTDSKGDDSYNQNLSDRRAQSVRDWLIAHEIRFPMSIKGYGESKPVAPNETADGKDFPEGRLKNRRVEVVISNCSGPAR